MYLQMQLPSGINGGVVISGATLKRLSTTCFRRTLLPEAGMFLHWKSIYDLFRDKVIEEEFLAELDELWKKKEFGTHSINITNVESGSVGWESTAPLKDYPMDALEKIQLNRHAWGLCVKLSRRDLFAPKTREVTIVFEFKSNAETPIALIHSIYPGTDIGELDGDVTSREQRIFFNWNHPGEP